MDLHYKQEITVGALVLSAVVLFVLGTMWLGGKSLNPTANRVRVQFTDVGNMKRGNPVKISGVTLGTVDDIAFEGVGRVIVTLGLDRRIVPKLDASARITSIGLVGDVMVDFDPGQATERLPTDRVIVGEDMSSLTELGEDLSERAKVALDGFNEMANRRMADDLHRTLASVQRLADVFADQGRGPTRELTATLTTLQRLSQRLDSVLASPAMGRALDDLDSATVQLTRLTDQYVATGARLDTLLMRVNRGEGTLGRVATDTTLYAQLRDLSGSLKALVDDLRKNPGKLTVQVKLF